MTSYNRIRIGEQDFAWSTNVGSSNVWVQIRDRDPHDRRTSGTWIGSWVPGSGFSWQWNVADPHAFGEFDRLGYRHEMEVMLSVIRGAWQWRRDEARRLAKAPAQHKFEAVAGAISVTAYDAACEYPGTIDEMSVEQNLQAYCATIGIHRAVRRLRRGWFLGQEPALAQHVERILEGTPDIGSPSGSWGNVQQLRRNNLDAGAAKTAIAAANSPDALAARASPQAVLASYSRDGGDGLFAIEARQSTTRIYALADIAGATSRAVIARRIADELVTRCWPSMTPPGRDWWFFDLSHLALTAIGARELGLPQVSAWADPLFHAFVAGCWQLIWTEEVLYWVAKPLVRVDGCRLHCENGPAFDSDCESEPHYYWHGIRVEGSKMRRLRGARY